MITINTESILRALFYNGFEKIDPVLQFIVEEELVATRRYKVEDNDYSGFFNKYVLFDGENYKLRDSYNLNSNIASSGYLSLKDAMKPKSSLLVEDIACLDYNKVLAKKISEIGILKKNNYSELFCNKEKELLCEMFNINSSNVENANELRKSIK